MPEQPRIMVDIETLATTPDAAIVSIGAVAFDENGLGETLHISVSPESCRKHGRRVDKETVRWWERQPDEASHILHGGRTLPAALAELAGFVDGVGELWANSPAFDAVILESAFRACDAEAPWEYYQWRDVRTLRKCLPTWPDELTRGGVEHDALDDARYQARCVRWTLEGLETDAVADGGDAGGE